ncbi:hypothetical protein K431DRAFT_64207 [Polychaeton citri CBS 116435]|uniref:Uncharacterized protein n=1 Tax=Polychaeton citri CBS 116435 TaxID=1314669 RepID=A0A9P4UMZ7_9PEZI|nr:hypothetical protein K431DRAFT_64207 [Polychaeton citri CBS 116435]
MRDERGHQVINQMTCASLRPKYPPPRTDCNGMAEACRVPRALHNSSSRRSTVPGRELPVADCLGLLPCRLQAGQLTAPRTRESSHLSESLAVLGVVSAGFTPVL